MRERSYIVERDRERKGLRHKSATIARLNFLGGLQQGG